MKLITPCWITHLTLFACAMLAPVSFTSGGEGDGVPLTLEDCLQRAMSRNPALEAAYYRHLAATRVNPQVTSLPEPQMTWTHFVEQVQTRTGPQENQFMISQTIPWFGKLRLRGEVADHEAEAARLGYEDVRLALVRDVSLAWFDYAYLARETEITRESRDLLGSLSPIVEEQVRAGAPLTRQLTLELALGRMETQLDELAGRRGEASARLRALMGDDTADREPLSWPELTDPGERAGKDFDNLLTQLRERHPRLAALDEMASSAKTKSLLARKNALPDPIIGASVIDIGDQGDTAAGISIGFRIPLAFRKYRAEREEAADRERVALADREDAELRLRAELKGAWERLQAQSRTVSRYRNELIPAANRIIEVGVESYRAGSATIREVIDDQRDALDVRKAYWRAVADLHTATVRVATLAGDLTPLSLP